MDYKKRSFFIGLFILTLTFVPISAEPPGEDLVKKEWTRLLTELEQPAVNESTDNEFLWDIAKGVDDFFKTFGIFIIIFVIAFFLISLYRGGGKFTSLFRKEAKAAGLSGGNNDASGNTPLKILTSSGLYEKAVSLGNGENFPEAVILLHKASILFLLEKKILLPQNEYTNKDIRQILGENNTFYKSFSRLSLFSEKAAFRDHTVEKEVYTEAEALFRAGFTGGNE